MTGDEREGLIDRLKDAAQCCHRPLRYPEDNTRIHLLLLEAAEALAKASGIKPGE